MSAAPPLVKTLLSVRSLALSLGGAPLVVAGRAPIEVHEGQDGIRNKIISQLDALLFSDEEERWAYCALKKMRKHLRKSLKDRAEGLAELQLRQEEGKSECCLKEDIAIAKLALETVQLDLDKVRIKIKEAEDDMESKLTVEGGRRADNFQTEISPPSMHMLSHHQSLHPPAPPSAPSPIQAPSNVQMAEEAHNTEAEGGAGDKVLTPCSRAEDCSTSDASFALSEDKIEAIMQGIDPSDEIAEKHRARDEPGEDDEFVCGVEEGVGRLSFGGRRILWDDSAGGGGGGGGGSCASTASDNMPERADADATPSKSELPQAVLRKILTPKQQETSPVSRPDPSPLQALVSPQDGLCARGALPSPITKEDSMDAMHLCYTPPSKVKQMGGGKGRGGQVVTPV